MNEAAVPVGPLNDALLALRLFLMAPVRLGGLSLRGGGPARDLVLEKLREDGAELRRIPMHVDDERLLGGVDFAASIASGHKVRQRGLLEEAAGCVFVVPLAERLPEAIAGRIAQELDAASMAGGFGLVLLDDGIEPDDRPPSCLLERIAFDCDLSRVASLDVDDAGKSIAIEPDAVALLDDRQLASIAATASALGIPSVRPMLFAAETARLHAALNGREQPDENDLQIAARLVLAPRARQLPASEPEPAEAQNESPAERTDDGSETSEGKLEDIVLEAAAAAIPPDLLAQLSSGKANRNAAGSGSGKRRKSALRGKPIGVRPGVPRGGARLTLIDTMRAAIPWQALRRRQRGEDRRLIVQKEDLRIRRFEERAARLTIFCVDASGSAAAARLAEAKGAVELMLAQAYATRSEVALVAFRGTAADLILPPTRSLTRARRALAELPGGGGTPLAMGLQAAREVALSAEARGRTPHLVVLTDGRGNIAADGSASRSRSGQDVEQAARAIAAHGVEALVVDISARPGPDGPRLAELMQARFLALPMADARKLHAAVRAATPSRAA
ncbi:magnesium chelatase subunit D [Qipengyuania sp. XHP0207]|uniref:magnesium chelatase subunit D n=1 Tax=Qipengyuania sp. XHP0207 TaxID=3038078 RepID=UPI00241EAD50|nr:magnesium chelatase subunit D [Qipengyuania sp. XHP0207]MDG5749068.1 magnesium chelatase subunit D [Qipengyuania sp. XHP0207]